MNKLRNKSNTNSNIHAEWKNIRRCSCDVKQKVVKEVSRVEVKMTAYIKNILTHDLIRMTIYCPLCEKTSLAKFDFNGSGKHFSYGDYQKIIRKIGKRYVWDKHINLIQLLDLYDEFYRENYNLFTNNCKHFAGDLLKFITKTFDQFRRED